MWGTPVDIGGLLLERGQVAKKERERREEERGERERERKRERALNPDGERNRKKNRYGG